MLRENVCHTLSHSASLFCSLETVINPDLLLDVVSVWYLQVFSMWKLQWICFLKNYLFCLLALFDLLYSLTAEDNTSILYSLLLFFLPLHESWWRAQSQWTAWKSSTKNALSSQALWSVSDLTWTTHLSCKAIGLHHSLVGFVCFCVCVCRSAGLPVHKGGWHRFPDP